MVTIMHGSRPSHHGHTFTLTDKFNSFYQNLKEKTLSDDALIQAMVDEPKLIQRPIVINGDKAKLGRPPEQVLEIV